MLFRIQGSLDWSTYAVGSEISCPDGRVSTSSVTTVAALSALMMFGIASVAVALNRASCPMMTLASSTGGTSDCFSRVSPSSRKVGSPDSRLPSASTRSSWGRS